MRLTTITILVLAAAILGGLSACQREASADRSNGTATHPWEMGDRSIHSLRPEMPARRDNNGYNPEAEVENPTLPGPALSKTDTLDPALLPGVWYPVCGVREEKMDLTDLEQVMILRMQPDGAAFFDFVQNGELANSKEGYWSKPEAGKISMSVSGGVPKVSSAEIFGTDFLYIWDYDMQIGSWYVRAPREGTQTINANRFDTSRGKMVFTNVVGRSYEGFCESTNKIDLRGIYANGILTMRWEDQKGRLGGYAAFLVAPDWETLTGVWWVDDYEAAPFGGAWTATRLAGETTTME